MRDRAGRSRHWLYHSMTGTMRSVAVALASVCLTLTLLLAGVIYTIGSNPAPVDPGAAPSISVSQPTGRTAQESVSEEGTEQIDDQDVPLAAAPSAAPAKRGVPTYVVLGVLLGAAGTYLYLHLRKINANIKVMRRNLR